MKNNIGRLGLVILFAISLGLSMPAAAQGAKCSLARASGNWSFTDNGTVIGVGPRTAVGTFTLDGAGNVLNGTATSSLNGAISDETFSGTYTVNSNCTGTVSVAIYASGTEIFALTMNIAFDDNMRELRAIFTSVVEPNGTSLATAVAFDARKQ